MQSTEATPISQETRRQIEAFFDQVYLHFMSTEFSREKSGDVLVSMAQTFVRELQSVDNVYRLIAHHMGTLVVNRLSFSFNLEAAELVLQDLAQYWKTALGADTAQRDLEVALVKSGHRPKKIV